MNRVIKKLIYSPIFKFFRPIYIYFTSRPYTPIPQYKERKSILISYLTKPFRYLDDKNYLNGHQNRREVLLLDSVLNNLDFNRRYVRFDCPTFFKRKYDVVFGLEPNFIKAANKNPDSLKVYYATGAYWKHQNRMIETRTDKFNKEHNSNVKYSRLNQPHNAAEIADYIIQIGSQYTIKTYPEELRNKIIPIRQTCHNFTFENFLNRKIEQFELTDFVWMGSNGTILKGLDLLIDYFLIHPELRLHIIGPIDPDVMDVYENIIKDKDNIKVYGFLDLDSNLIEEIALKCSYVIVPSASEGGCPGAVINMMKLGCIPVVSEYAAFDEIEKFGFLIKDFSLSAIEDTIKELRKITRKDAIEKVKNIFHFANNNFNQNVFVEDMKNAFELILNKHSEYSK